MIEIGSTSDSATGFDLPHLIETRLLIQARSGGGKSWAIRRLLEQSHGQVQQIVLDLEGEFPSLRERFDYVIAGRGGDTPAQPKSAGKLARRLLELRVSAICDLYELQKHERVRFVRLFIESLMSAPKKLWRPVLVVLDEAHIYCPEKGQSESMGAVIDLVTRGRKRGLCGVLATQRLAKLHKDACAELLNKMIGGATLDIDRRRASEELGLTRKEEVLSLRDLRPGDFHAYGPALRDNRGTIGGVIQLKVGPVQSHHPRVGSRQLEAPPVPTDKIKKVLGQLSDLPEEAEREAKSLGDLRKEVTQLKRELTIAHKKAEKQCGHGPVIEKLESQLGQQQAQMDELTRLIIGAREGAENLVNLLKKPVPVAPSTTSPRTERRLPRARIPLASTSTARKAADPPPPPSSSPVASSNAEVDEGTLKPAEQRVIDTLGTCEVLGLAPADRKIVAALSGFSQGGYFNNILGRLRNTLGLIDYPNGGTVSLTEAGRAAVLNWQSFACKEDIHEFFYRNLKGPKKVDILQTVIARYPDAIPRDELAAIVGLSEGGYYNNLLGNLRGTYSVIDYPTGSQVRAADWLFPKELA